ncbi:glycosyltransferase [Psychroserpens burtonensis]|uniref:Glycosyltransferase n=1 Tax=Psychroserpens burtonensis TaxID=49278 RepID=A0A5C7BJD8_9FLAO|nr:glycosyltransferase [Psychroserpens burtonensis]TXE20242.1 glycosyltransferase [Psychroserpens burtonensis]
MQKKQTIDWLFVLPDDLIGGGAQQVLFTIINAFIAEGKNCTIVFLIKKHHYGWEVLENECNIVYLNNTSVYKGFFSAAKHIRTLKKTHHIKHAISSQALINGLLGFLKYVKILKNTKLVLRESTSIFLRFKGFKLLLYKTAYVIGYKQADLIVCQTSLMKEQLLKALPWLNKKNKAVIIPNPVNLDEIDTKSKEVIDFEIENFLVAAGRFIPEKGFDLLIAAFNQLENKNLKLVILGVGTDDEHQKLIDQIASLNLQKRVILYGYVKNVYPIFKKAKLCVVSSRIEGFPNVLLQMMSQNSNVVSTICAGEISNIKGVITCETHDEIALKDAIHKGLENTNDNRTLYFNDYIKSRSIDNFVTTMLNQIND